MAGHNDIWTEGLWVCVKGQKHTRRKELVNEVKRLIRHGFRRFNCHLKTIWSTEITKWNGEKDPHAHLIVLCRTDELERFWVRYKNFNLEAAWAYERNVFIERFNAKYKQGAYIYALAKHSVEEQIYTCPKYYNRCKYSCCYCDENKDLDLEIKHQSSTTHKRC